MMVRDKFKIGGAALLRGLDFGRRGSAALPLIAAILFFAFGAMAQLTNDLSGAEIQGRQLAQQLLEQLPAENMTNIGVLKVSDQNGIKTNLPVRFETLTGLTNWQAIYTVSFVHYDNSNNFGWEGEILTVAHAGNQQNRYEESFAFTYGGKIMGQVANVGPNGKHTRILFGEETMTPFARSDFWIADLGLEFFHWPGQKILKHEMRRGRACKVLESTNPSPSTNGYSRVVSWIDNESGGIVQAEAYDFKNKLLKEFAPKSFKKVNGQWELQEMEIRNVQTGSRTRLEFDLK